jgi:hypothetical protein
MSFTDRFISIPIRIFSQKEKEIMGKEQCEDSIMRINPFEVSRYYPSDDEGTPCTQIVFRDGGSTCAYMTTEEFEKLLNSFITQNQ